MTNDVPMTKEVPMMNDEKARARLFVLRASPLIRHSSFELPNFLMPLACATRLEGLGACSKFPRVAHP